MTASRRDFLAASAATLASLPAVHAGGSDVLTVGLVWLVRPVALRHLHPAAAAITGTDALVGKEAIVLSEVTADGGRVRLNGSEWSARARDPQQQLSAGTRVSVVAIEGATAVVWQDPFG